MKTITMHVHAEISRLDVILEHGEVLIGLQVPTPPAARSPRDPGPVVFLVQQYPVTLWAQTLQSAASRVLPTP